MNRKGFIIGQSIECYLPEDEDVKEIFSRINEKDFSDCINGTDKLYISRIEQEDEKKLNAIENLEQHNILPSILDQWSCYRGGYNKEAKCPINYKHYEVTKEQIFIVESKSDIPRNDSMKLLTNHFPTTLINIYEDKTFHNTKYVEL